MRLKKKKKSQEEPLAIFNLKKKRKKENSGCIPAWKQSVDETVCTRLITQMQHHVGGLIKPNANSAGHADGKWDMPLPSGVRGLRPG